MSVDEVDGAGQRPQMTVGETLARGCDVDNVIEMAVDGHGAPRPRHLDVPPGYFQLIGEEGDVTGRGIVGAEELENPTSHRSATLGPARQGEELARVALC